MFSIHSCICFCALLCSGLCNEEIIFKNIFSANGDEDLIINNVISKIHYRMDKEAIKKSLDDFTMVRRKTHFSIPGIIVNGNAKSNDTVIHKNNFVDMGQTTVDNDEIIPKYNADNVKLQDSNAINEKEQYIKKHRADGAEYEDPMDIAGKNDVERLYEKYKENNFESVLTPDQEMELLKVYNKQKELLRNIKAINNKNKKTTTKKKVVQTAKTTPKKTTTKKAITTKKTTKAVIKNISTKATTKTVPKKDVKKVPTTKATTTTKTVKKVGPKTENSPKVQKLMHTLKMDRATVATTIKSKKRRTTEKKDEADFYDLVAEMETKNEIAKKLPNYTPFTFETTTTTVTTTRTTTKASTVLTILNEMDIREALKKDPYVKRILQMANRKRQKYMEKALINIIN